MIVLDKNHKLERERHSFYLLSGKLTVSIPMRNTLHEFQATPVKRSILLFKKKTVGYNLQINSPKKCFWQSRCTKTEQIRISPDAKPERRRLQGVDKKHGAFCRPQQDRDGGLGVGFCQALVQYFGGRIFVCGVLGTVEQ